jgi:hypothetical protein
LIDQVHIQDEWHRNTKRVIVLWEQLSEAAPPDEKIGFVMPEGALEAIVEAAGGIAPQPATDRHLQDAIDVRNRLLAIVEKP